MEVVDGLMVRSIAVLIVFIVLAAAQNRMSSLRGDVRDPSGAPVEGAAVTVESEETGREWQQTTDAAGTYRMPRLEPGMYRVSVRRQGFAANAHDGVSLMLDRETALVHTLALAEGSGSLTVTATAGSVDAAASSLSSIVEQRRIQELPLNGRDYLQLALTQPGTHVARAQTQTGNTGFGVQLTVAGSRPAQNNYRLDGISMTNQTGSTPGSINGVNLGVEAIREFSILTSGYSAQYGRAAGGIVNAVTQSGSNEFRASAFYFHRNSALDARNFFDPGPPPGFRRHQFGGSLAGPVVRNRTFFLVSTELLREGRDQTAINTTLSDAAREGRLSGGTVPIDPAIAPLIALYPSPTGAVLGNTGLYVFGNNRSAGEEFVTTRLDHALSERDSLFLRYTFDDARRAQLTNFGLNDLRDSTRVASLALEETHVVHPGLVNAVRFGMNRSRSGLGETRARNPGADDPALSALPGRGSLPLVNVVGLSEFPGGTRSLDADLTNFLSLQVYNDVSWMKGRHLVRFGGSFERMHFFLDSQSNASGEFSFGAIADLLANQPNRFRALLPGSDTERNFRQEMFAWYFVDSIRLSRTFTLDVSLRHEWVTLPRETAGKLANLINLTDREATPGVLFLRNPSFTNLAPRAGFAWSPGATGRTVIRGGYGIYHDQILSQFLLLSGARTPPFFLQADVRDLEPGAFPGGAYQALADRPIVSLRAERIDPRPGQPYVQQWNFNVQRTLPAGLLARMAYAGSHGVRLSTMVEDANLVQPDRLADGRLFFPAGGARLNPEYGFIRNRLFNGHSFYHALQADVTRRWTRGMQIQAAYTFAKSLDDDSSTFARTESSNSIGIPVDGIPDFNRGPSNHDVRHTVAVTGLWDLPALPRRLSALLGAWKLGGMFTAGSGLPFSAVLGYDAARTGTSRPDWRGGQRPDANPAYGGNPVSGDPARWFDPAAFLRPTPGFLGNLGRNTLRGPGLANLDMMLSHERPIARSDRLRLSLRVETFNLLNHTNFHLPTSQRMHVFTATSIPEDVGRLTGAAPSRQIQVGARISF